MFDYRRVCDTCNHHFWMIVILACHIPYFLCGLFISGKIKRKPIYLTCRYFAPIQFSYGFPIVFVIFSLKPPFCMGRLDGICHRKPADRLRELDLSDNHLGSKAVAKARWATQFWTMSIYICIYIYIWKLTLYLLYIYTHVYIGELIFMTIRLKALSKKQRRIQLHLPTDVLGWLNISIS
jgi:hypothetical protein